MAPAGHCQYGDAVGTTGTPDADHAGPNLVAQPRPGWMAGTERTGRPDPAQTHQT